MAKWVQDVALPFTPGQNDGALANAESATEFQSVIGSVLWTTAGESFAHKMSLRTGIYLISDTLLAWDPVVIEGETSFGTRLMPGATFTPGEYLLSYAKDVGGTSLLIGDDNHVPGYGLRHIGFDGDLRTALVHGLYQNFTNRSIFDDVHARWIKGTVFKADASLLESKFYGWDTWLCGSYGHAVMDFYDVGSGTDGHNLNRFVDCRLMASLGDHLRIGSPVVGQPIVRQFEFIGCTFHGLLDYFDAYGDTDVPVGNNPQVPLDDEGNMPMRVVVENARGIDFIGCRSVAPGRGMPNLLISEGALGATAINNVKVIGGTWSSRAPFYDRTVASVIPASDTISTLEIFVGIDERHHLSTGSKLQFTTGTPPAPLVALTDYYAIRVDQRYFKVATTRANAIAGTAINLTDAGSGTIVYRQSDQGITAVDTGTDTITSADHRLCTEARIRFATDGGTLPTGITALTDYFAIRVDKDNFKVATTRLNATLGTAVNITAAGSSNYWIPQNFAIVVEGGDLIVIGAEFDQLANRACIKLDTVRANVDIDSNTTQFTGTLVEDSTGSTITNVTRNVGGLWMSQNNTAIQLTTAAGVARSAIRMSAGDAMLFGDINAGGHIAQMLGQGAVDLIVSGTTRVRADTSGAALTGRMQFTEIADPAAGAVNTGLLYVRDNGAGKTQLCVRFNTGAIQVLATEP